MYKKGIYEILRNEPLTDAVWRMVLGGDTEWITRPGQFVNIALEGRYLRRPISVCDWDGRTLTLIYKVVGDGTAQMSRMQPGQRLDLLTGLGNGFSTRNEASRPLLVGGGVGGSPRSMRWRASCAAAGFRSRWCWASTPRGSSSMPMSSGRWAATSTSLRRTARWG